MSSSEESKQGFDWTTTVYVLLILVPVFFASIAIWWYIRKTLRARKQKQTDIEMNDRRREWWQPNYLEDAAAAEAEGTEQVPKMTPKKRNETVDRYWQELYTSAENQSQQPVPPMPIPMPSPPQPTYAPSSVYSQDVVDALGINFSRPRSTATAPSVTTTTRTHSTKVPKPQSRKKRAESLATVTEVEEVNRDVSRSHKRRKERTTRGDDGAERARRRKRHRRAHTKKKDEMSLRQVVSSLFSGRSELR
ncbi:hypothetical protein OQA88_6832 [Cercophora sp. LCS_1]